MRRTHLLATAATIVAWVAAAGAAVAVPAPAAADQPVTTMSVAIAPLEVKQGSRFTLSGRAGYGDSGNAAPVDLYFRKSEADAEPYVRIATVGASSSGRFRATLTAKTSGHYYAFYRGNGKRGFGSASDYLAAYTSTIADRTVYTWSGTRLQCHPQCVTTGPVQKLGAAPVRVTFERECARAKSGGGLGFIADPETPPTKGDPGWRDFPEGAGPTGFELAPAVREGRFHLRWSSPAGAGAGCDLTFTATQRSEHKQYV
jgi:hypothetical protein